MASQKINKAAIIKKIEAPQLKKDVPNFQAGDVVVVSIKIIENKKTRIQKFEGVVLRTVGRGISKTFIVRKETDGVGIEKNFHVHNPNISIELKRQGRVRRAYISYMRQRSGKSARIQEKVRTNTTQSKVN
ncbi:50S ribosomal protein L19 [[Mycoplasma] testudinis]|uniref:50S ribosomal protein L19 n=1 Tax=[Mycoplasma] testudinis TaxID=33924 RepID=UPI000488DF80|nr:50S ribosomal protein L19 [[Mycoplasma] testudinis]